jgi:glucose-1-phosphate thymidylyltransferase
MLAGIRDILLISTPRDINLFQSLLGDGSNYGINLTYAVQENPNGIAQSFLLGEKFIDNKKSALILGDNIFYGSGFISNLYSANQSENASIFSYYVDDPRPFGVINLDDNGKPVSLEEKPDNPTSNLAVTGLYFYDSEVVEITKSLKPSTRGELEITDLNLEYLKKGKLEVEMIGRGNAWLDTGNPDSLLQASQFIQTIQTRQGLMVACLEEIALKQNWIDKEDLARRLPNFKKTSYDGYLKKLISE